MKNILFIVALCCTLFGCSYNVLDLEASEEISVQLPTWPPSTYKTPQELNLSPYPHLSRWKVQITSAGQVCTYFTKDEKISFTVKKNEPLAVSVTPITLTTDGEEVQFFKPAGMIYPYEECFSWEGGFSTAVFERLFASKKETGVTTEHMNAFLKSFNWKKLSQTIQKKVEESVNEFSDEATKSPVFYNPWQIDLYTLLDNLCYGNFKATFVNAKNVLSYSVEKLEVGKGQVNLLSSFVPENEILWQYGKISIKKDLITSISCNIDLSILITYFSSKKISQEVVFMPIFKEEI